MEKIRKLIAASWILDLQLFAEAGTLVNATGNYVNAYTGSTTSFDPPDTLSPTMKTYYDTELLENHREQLIFAQLGKKESLPARHGRTIEWRKWNTLPNLKQLQEGVIPTGEKMGMTSITVDLAQYGLYVTISDLLELHALDDTILGATEELGASGGKTNDILVRNVLAANTVILFADAYNGTTYASTPTSKAELIYAVNTSHYIANLTPDMIAKAVTLLKKNGAPTYSGGKYVAVVHPSVAYDLRKNPDWLEAHKYARPEEIFNGEIGELHGVRFIESNLAPVIKSTTDSDAIATYKTIFLGKDAFAVIDPEGAGMETIIHDKRMGGPLEQFSTVGVKLEMAAKVLYPKRMVTVWSASNYSGVDAEN